MSDFQSRSRDFLRDTSTAAEWMMAQNAGGGHWWRWQVLTSANPDKSRPIFEDIRAQEIFEELRRRDLLFEIRLDDESNNLPAYQMRHDVDGWDKAVSDGRPAYGYWLKLKRNWLMLSIVFLLGCFLTSVENRTVGLIDRYLDGLINLRQERTDQTGDTKQSAWRHGAGT